MARRGTRQKQEGLGLGQMVGVALALAVIVALLPMLLVGEALPSVGDSSVEPEALLPIDRTPSLSTETGRRDRGRAVRLLQKDGTVAELTMEDYLWCVVAAEMPASFSPEALKAQACAARTYTVVLQNSATKHAEAEICADSSCCQAYTDKATALAKWGLNGEEYANKIATAIAETDGRGILYEEKPIQALFFSSAAGQTLDAVEVWGNSISYLKGVTSPEGDEVPNYHSEVILSAEEVRAAVVGAYPGADLSNDPSTWFSQRVENSAGGVSSILVGGVTLTGGQMRTLFALRSTSFSVAYDGASFAFTVTGHGHGVGMSQYGANAMAKEGKTMEEILTWYYTDTQVGYLWE